MNEIETIAMPHPISGEPGVWVPQRAFDSLTTRVVFTCTEEDMGNDPDD